MVREGTLVSKVKTVFRCEGCGATTPRWEGRCSVCGEWDSLREESESREDPAAEPRRRGSVFSDTGARPLSEVTLSSEPRDSTGFPELDRVLGGGIVPGAAILLGGDPGIGKSTLLLQVADELSKVGKTTLYVSGEETSSQLKLRGERLGAKGDGILALSSTDLDLVVTQITNHRPSLVVLDSVQTLHCSDVSGGPGSASQLRECAQGLVSVAKTHEIPIFLIGHVTKEGILAGPRLLEHLVDTVLYFEGDRHHSHRILRAVKNRFGPTDEVGIFEMGERGLEGVADPSRLFVPEEGEGVIPEPGTVVFPALEGTRCILVEVQALTAPSPLGTPARRVSGVSPHRVSMVLAVLEQKTRVSLDGHDVFVNAVGGVSLREPACDLAIAMAVASCRLGFPMPPRTVVAGEVGLAGEVRRIGQVSARLKEARRLGFSRAVLPSGTEVESKASRSKAAQKEEEESVTGVMKVVEALSVLVSSEASPRSTR